MDQATAEPARLLLEISEGEELVARSWQLVAKERRKTEDRGRGKEAGGPGTEDR